MTAQLPDPAAAAQAAPGFNAVIRLAIQNWDAVCDGDHPEREFDVHENPYVEFQLIRWKDKRGGTTPRWVLRGLVAI